MLEGIAVKVDQDDKLVCEYLNTHNPALKEKVIHKYLAFVKYIIGRLKLPSKGLLKRDDLIQYGIIGLLDAIERFNPDLGVGFKTFAYKRIQGEIVDALRKSGAYSRSQMQAINKIRAASDHLRTILGREPNAHEICDEVNISLKEFYRIRRLMNLGYTLSLEDRIETDAESHSLPRKEMIPDQDQEPPDVIMENESIKAELKHHIKNLPERERIILALYYYEELTLNDIGRVLGISESRVSQILSNTLARLKQKLTSE